MTALCIGPKEQAALADLAKRAAERPVDMPPLMERLNTPEGKSQHMAQMTEQSVNLPGGWCVTFSIEQGHPIGDCRHMSMSINKSGRLPNEHAVWMVAELLGFWGSLGHCDGIWKEKLRQGDAINVVQRIAPGALQ